MKVTTENLIALCDALASNPTYASAARKIGVNERTVWRWLKASAAGAPEFVFEYLDETLPLHLHVKTAIKQSVLAVEARARDIGLNGWAEPVFFQGRPQFKEREDIVAAGHAELSPDDLEFLYGQRDTFERDSKGNRIQLTVMHRPSANDLALVLKAHLPKLYGDHKTVDVNHGGGVLVVGSRAPAPIPAPVATPAALPPPKVAAAVVEAIAEVAIESVPDNVIDESDPDEIVGGKPYHEPELPGPSPDDDLAEGIGHDAPPVPIVEPEPALAADPPPAPPSREVNKDSPLVRDLLARMKAGPANPQPRGPVHKFIGADG
jgi:hypothetical protein